MRRSDDRHAVDSFTLVELLVAMAIFTILLIVLASLIGQISKTWSYTTARADQFREARNGFEAMTRRISQATLNSYTDYVKVSGTTMTYRSALTNAGTVNIQNFVPNAYARASELRYISGPGLAGSTTSTPVRPTHAAFFQAPLGFTADDTDYGGLANLLNTWGYYIEFNSDVAVEPSFVRSLPSYVPRYRYRLMEMMEPSESLSVYKYTSGNPGLSSLKANGENWFSDPLNLGTEAHVLAENIVALIIIPRLSPEDQTYASAQGNTAGDGMLAPFYTYDSTSSGQAATYSSDATVAGIVNTRNQLPPTVEIVMVAVDEPSFKRLEGTSTTAPNLGLASLFSTVGTNLEDKTQGYAKDLQTLENTLTADKLSYRVFSTSVAVKSAKWSRDQTN